MLWMGACVTSDIKCYGYIRNVFPFNVAVIVLLMASGNAFCEEIKRDGYTVTSSGQLVTELAEWNSSLESSYVFRNRSESTGASFFLHCKPNSGPFNGWLIRLRDDGSKSVVNDNLPAPYVWWDDEGRIVAFSDSTPFAGKVIGHRSALLGVHTIQLGGSEFKFGDLYSATLCDFSESGKYMYLFTLVDRPPISKNEDVQLRIVSASAPQDVYFHSAYKAFPSIYERNGIIHIFSHSTDKYNCRKFLHEKLVPDSDGLGSAEKGEIKALDSFFSSRFSISFLDSNADFVLVYCSVDMPFSSKSHFQKIELRSPYLRTRLRGLESNTVILPWSLSP